MHAQVFGCFDQPSETEPALIDCVACDGVGCPACDDTGEIEIPHCPKALLDDGVMELLSLVRDADEGAMPCGGGVGDQTEWFLTARDAVRRERAAREREDEEEAARRKA